MASLKTKGDLAELKVAADLVERGYRIALPFGEDVDFDLILIRGKALERVQVKYTESNGRYVQVRCRSHSLTKGKVRRTKLYTSEMIEWIAVYDRTDDQCYYVPVGRARDQGPLGDEAAPDDTAQQPTSQHSLGERLPRSRDHSSFDGASRTRTGDLRVANAALSQLSYGPVGADCRSGRAASGAL